MPINEVTYFQAACDACGNFDDAGDCSAFSEPGRAAEVAVDDGWVEIQDALFCPDCIPPVCACGHLWDDHQYQAGEPCAGESCDCPEFSLPPDPLDMTKKELRRLMEAADGMTIDQLRELSKAATPGPWISRHRDVRCTIDDDESSAGLGLELDLPEPQLRGQFARAADVAFMVAARAHFDALLDVAEVAARLDAALYEAWMAAHRELRAALDALDGTH